MLYASLSAVGVQLLSVLAGLMFQLLLSIRVRKRIQQVVVQYQEVVKQQEAAKKARPAPPRVSPPPPPREFPVYRWEAPHGQVGLGVGSRLMSHQPPRQWRH
jgi:hypothetical protein